MGISGLLPMLKSIQRQTELKKFAGTVLGVDAYVWLHRGAIACAIELAEGKPTRKYVDFAMHRVRMMKHHGVTPYLVFDGDFLPSKAGTEESREKLRKESKKLGLELLKAGKVSQAYPHLQKAIDVTPEMAGKLIDELKKNDVPYLVAPYEADAQLVYLERQGLITGIITEDSDLLVFGAKRLLTKLDQYGQCVEINRKDFCAVREIALTGWTDKEFRSMAILSGCDYLKGIEQVGLKTAHRMVRKYKTPEKVVRMLQFDGKHRVPEGYLDLFKQAELTFLYQRVFCPKKQELVFLTEPDSSIDVENMPFLGAAIEKEVARAIASGDLNPISRQALVSTMPRARRNASQRGSGLPTTSSNVSSNAALGRSIESYFQERSAKPPGPPDTPEQGHRRIPLGAMDPNCFVIKPRQSSDGTAAVPRGVFPLPRPYLEHEAAASSPVRPYLSSRALRRSEPISALLQVDSAAPSRPSRRNTTALISRSSDLSTTSAQQERCPSPRPMKKQRVCNDAPETLSDDASETSKFFLHHKADATGVQKSDPILMSDDTIEHALSSLPDVSGWQSPRLPNVQIFNDGTKSTAKSQGLGAPMGNEDADAANEKHHTESPPQEMSSAHELTTQPTHSESEHGRRSLQRFSFTPTPALVTSSKRTVMVHGLPTPSSSMQKSSAASSRPVRSTFLQTPLQRLASQAMQRGKRALSNLRSPGLHVAKTSTQGLPSPRLSPVSVPLPKVDLAEVEALHKPCGSEDQIMPESDTEDDGLDGRRG